MLITVYFFIVNVVIPQIGFYGQTLLEPVMVTVITLAGIVMLFGAVGFRISSNLGSTVVGGIFNAIGYIGSSLIHGIGWIIRSIFNAVPRVFNESRRLFSGYGLEPWISNALAVIVTILFLIIVI